MQRLADPAGLVNALSSPFGASSIAESLAPVSPRAPANWLRSRSPQSDAFHADRAVSPTAESGRPSPKPSLLGRQQVCLSLAGEDPAHEDVVELVVLRRNPSHQGHGQGRSPSLSTALLQLSLSGKHDTQLPPRAQHRSTQSPVNRSTLVCSGVKKADLRKPSCDPPPTAPARGDSSPQKPASAPSKPLATSKGIAGGTQTTPASPWSSRTKAALQQQKKRNSLDLLRKATPADNALRFLRRSTAGKVAVPKPLSTTFGRLRAEMERRRMRPYGQASTDDFHGASRAVRSFTGPPFQPSLPDHGRDRQANSGGAGGHASLANRGGRDGKAMSRFSYEQKAVTRGMTTSKSCTEIQTVSSNGWAKALKHHDAPADTSVK